MVHYFPQLRAFYTGWMDNNTNSIDQGSMDNDTDVPANATMLSLCSKCLLMNKNLVIIIYTINEGAIWERKAMMVVTRLKD